MAPSAAEMTKNSSAEVLEEAVTLVFQPGTLAVEAIQVNDKAVPSPVLIVAPKDAGTYPVAMLLHGFSLQNQFYKQLLGHVASHGFIMVAPQFHLGDTLTKGDIAPAAKVADWLPEGLPSVLPKGVEPELSKLALAGHSRGGHTAFSLALGHAQTKLNFSALIGLDPVAGTGKSFQLQPKILTNEPSSFDMAMPVLVIGTGLGECGLLPSAPRGVNHADFYRKCGSPCYYFVTRDYGHLDMLDDDTPKFFTYLCKDGDGSKDRMRRCVAGIIVAFLNAALGNKDGDLEVILRDPAVAPAMLDPVEHRLAHARTLSKL
uniref:Chlorophyllase n=1 Tax=Poa pratensis subsp. pratensis TaxID=368382 RepID=A0A165YG74_POAPR|nr:chlorophyllase [Poa pratensis subsp. pratensis]